MSSNLYAVVYHNLTPARRRSEAMPYVDKVFIFSSFGDADNKYEELPEDQVDSICLMGPIGPGEDILEADIIEMRWDRRDKNGRPFPERPGSRLGNKTGGPAISPIIGNRA